LNPIYGQRGQRHQLTVKPELEDRANGSDNRKGIFKEAHLSHTVSTAINRDFAAVSLSSRECCPQGVSGYETLP